jgi:hypothetical protein
LIGAPGSEFASLDDAELQRRLDHIAASLWLEVVQPDSSDCEAVAGPVWRRGDRNLDLGWPPFLRRHFMRAKLLGQAESVKALHFPVDPPLGQELKEPATVGSGNAPFAVGGDGRGADGD